MAEVKFYPSKLRRGRVQLTADEIEFLYVKVRDDLKYRRADRKDEDKLFRLLGKLSRAHNRISS